jgi:hypothetical protein
VITANSIPAIVIPMTIQDAEIRGQLENQHCVAIFEKGITPT